MEFVLQRERKEAERKRIEATEKLAFSTDHGTIVISVGKGGPPIILNPNTGSPPE